MKVIILIGFVLAGAGSAFAGIRPFSQLEESQVTIIHRTIAEIEARISAILPQGFENSDTRASIAPSQQVEGHRETPAKTTLPYQALAEEDRDMEKLQRMLELHARNMKINIERKLKHGESGKECGHLLRLLRYKK